MQFLSNFLQNEIHRRGGEQRISIGTIGELVWVVRVQFINSEKLCELNINQTNAQIFVMLRQIIHPVRGFVWADGLTQELELASGLFLVFESNLMLGSIGDWGSHPGQG